MSNEPRKIEKVRSAQDTAKLQTDRTEKQSKPKELKSKKK
jgi:hypothetical protein